MKTLHRAMVVLVLTMTMTYAAAPPGRWRALTKEEAKHVSALLAIRNRHADKGEFEQATKVAEEIADYRAERQGKHHHEAIDARYAIEEWQRMSKVVAKARSEVLRARKAHEEGVGLLNQGRAREAEKPFRQALEIRKQILGDRHPDTAGSYNNVAYCLNAHGKTAEALPLYQKALEIQQQVLGDRHPDTATSYNNVAYCLYKQGKVAEALPLYRKALEIQQQVLGDRHPDTAASYNGVAGCLNAQGKTAEALPLYRKALEIQQQVLGDRHPDTAPSYNNVASCLNAQGKAAEALPLSRKALEIQQQVLGDRHPHTAASYNNLAMCLHSLNRGKEAALFFEKALLGFEYGRLSAGDTGFDRARYLVDRLTPSLGLSGTLVRLGEPIRAWAMGESDIGRGLLDDLSRPDLLPVEDRKKLAEVEALQNQLLPLITLKKSTVGQKKQFASLIEQRDKLQRELAEAAVRRARQRVATLAEVQKELPTDIAIVFWLDIGTLKEHLGCVVRHKGDPQWVTLPGTNAKGDWGEEDYSLVARTLTVIQETDANRLPGLLDQVRRQRLIPLEKHLKGIRHLIVLPTGLMSAFPVETLTDRYTISYAPSATIYARQRQQHRAFESKSALVLADPVFDREKAKEPTPPSYGLLVTSVLPKSLGLRIGLMPGDVVLEYDGKKLNKLDDLQYPKEEKTILVTLWRNGRIAKGRIPGGNLGLTFDKRPIAKALKDWRQRQDKLMAFARGKDWTPLPGTLVEARTLKTLIPDASLLLGSDANETKLSELATSGKLKDYRILHLATHGEANSKLPLQTALILAQDKLPTQKQQEERVLAGKKPLEGKLTVETVLRDWNLDADLVVLSACETGLGQQTYREGMLGFTQALLKKGARSVLLTRWEVDDAATSLLMRRFYQNVMGKRDGLKKPLPRAEALKEAKTWLRNLTSVEAQKELAVMLDSVPRGERGKIVAAKKVRVAETKSTDKKDRPFDHPYYWAAFILVGDPD